MTARKLPASLSSPIVSGRKPSSEILRLLAKPLILAASRAIDLPRSSACSSLASRIRKRPKSSRTYPAVLIISRKPWLPSVSIEMTELFARLAPGTTLDQARAELRSVYATMKKDHPEAYSKRGDFQISAKLLRDQITSGARTMLLVLLAASALVFVVACSNVANLILARTVRREGELAVRTALGASRGALRRMLLAESLLLCGAGAGLGVLGAQWMVEVLARYASRFSVRALELTVDSSLLWVGVALAIVAAVILAF